MTPNTKATLMEMLVLQVLLLIFSLSGLVQGFKPLSSSGSVTHREITQRAVLMKTAEVCRDIAALAGQDFSLTIDDSLTANQVQRACSITGTSTSTFSSIRFQSSIASMFLSNAGVDLTFLLSPKHHFDDETFEEGRDVITTGVSAVKESAKLKNFISARLQLGQLLHTLQDFYSHSNWVEQGNKDPFSILIRPDEALENLADIDTPTCRNCTGDDCTDNILPSLQQQRLLTSGYFSTSSSDKPADKCSHGGTFDLTSSQDPVGGINKDTVGSSHGSFHHDAADVAVKATMEVLEDIRVVIGDTNFTRLMGLSLSSALCFVIDTTGSMSDDIAEAKRVSFEIIDRNRGTPEEPSVYILVPFNDPGFGPLIQTEDADVFKENINKLTASGGGDNPELSLSGLQLALTTAPSSSEIFVFTDAPAKDSNLKGTITALIESSKSVVTFLLTDVLSSRRRRRGLMGGTSRTLSQSDTELYRDLARVSGGQTIEVTKSDLSLATSVIQDSTASALVTVFQAVKNPGTPDNFTFTVDGALQNMTVYITGASSLTFSLTDPSGVSQSSDQASGPLASLITAGNLRRLSLSSENQTGLWEISVDSNNPYSVKVTGQSSVNFFFNLVEAHEGPHGDFSLKEGRPLSGGVINLLVTVTGTDTDKVREVKLSDISGPTEVNGSLQLMDDETFLVTFSEVLDGAYVVRLRGEDISASSRTTGNSFQRQGSTQIRTSSITVTNQANITSVEPGSTISIPFTVALTANGVIDESATATFTIRANNDRSYTSTSPSTVSVTESNGGRANGIVTLTVPDSAATGTDVTLTIEAESEDGTDINFTVIRLSVTARVTDVTRPVCQEVSPSSSCPSSASLCATSTWTFITNLTDGINGTGIDSITVRTGNGTLNTSTVTGPGGENITVVTYSASCCSQSVELTVVDGAGNAGTCVGQARVLSTAAPVTTAAPETTAAPGTTTATGTTAAVNTTSSRGHSLSTSYSLWVSAVVSLLWRYEG